jgi:hypothetical protein
MRLLLLALIACNPDPKTSDHGVEFVLAPADLGAPVVSGSGFDPADGDALGLALDQTLPVFGGELGVWDAPNFIWELIQRGNVWNQGSCPFERVEDGATVYEGDCRSSFGYEFAGELRDEEWTVEAVDHHRIDADLVVTGDVDGAVFDTALLQGAIERAAPEDGSVVHYDVNLRLQLLGYWEDRPGEAARASAWQAWAVSGTVEEDAGTWRVDLAADVGGSGGFTLASQALVEQTSCPVELDGDATMGDGVEARFAASTCDACAELTFDEGSSSACAP